MRLQRMIDQLRHGGKLSDNHIIVGTLTYNIKSFLQRNGVAIHSDEIYLTHKGLSHLMRESKRKRKAGLSDSDILKIEEILRQPHKVVFDKRKNKVNLLYCSNSSECKKMIKVVVDTQAYDKKLGKVTLVKTAGYIYEANLNDPNYVEVETGGR